MECSTYEDALDQEAAISPIIEFPIVDVQPVLPSLRTHSAQPVLPSVHAQPLLPSVDDAQHVVLPALVCSIF